MPWLFSNLSYVIFDFDSLDKYYILLHLLTLFYQSHFVFPCISFTFVSIFILCCCFFLIVVVNNGTVLLGYWSYRLARVVISIRQKNPKQVVINKRKNKTKQKQAGIW